MRGPYWNEGLETKPWPEIEAWQSMRLAATAEELAARSAFYRRKLTVPGVTALASRGRDALADIPVTTKDELRSAQGTAEPGAPLGPQQGVPLGQIVQIVSSSGTTGRPLYYGLTRSDLDAWTDACANTFFTAGVRDHDVVAHLVGLPMVAGGLPYADGYRRIGATLAWLGGFTTERILSALPRVQATAMMATTSFGVYMTEQAESGDAPSPATLGIRKLQLGGEPGLPSARDRIRHAWQAEAVREGMGLADVLAAMWSECEQEDGMHFNAQAHVLIELVDPDHGGTIGWSEGTEGELLYTTIDREATPVLRYRSSDHVVVVGTSCSCGRTSPRIRCIGRTDDMLIYKGMNVFPDALRDIALQRWGTEISFGVVVYKSDRRQVQFDYPIPMEVEAQPHVQPSRYPALAREIQATIRDHLQVRVAVSVLPPGAIPASRHKATLVQVRPLRAEPVA